MGTVSSNIHIFFERSMMTMSGRNAVDKMLGGMVDGGFIFHSEAIQVSIESGIQSGGVETG